MRDGGKGDRKRPLVIPEEQFNANWDSIFGKKDKLTQGQELGVKIRQMIDELPISKEQK